MMAVQNITTTRRSPHVLLVSVIVDASKASSEEPEEAFVMVIHSVITVEEKSTLGP